MAEAVLFNIADEIISKLGSQVLQEIKRWWGVEDEVDKMKTTVSTIKAVLLHAEQQSMESPQVKTWLEMLRGAMYDADDLLDEFSTEALRQQLMSGSKMAKEVHLFFSSSNQLAYGLKMAHKIKAIRDRLDAIAANRKFFLEERTGAAPITTRSGREQTHSSPPKVVIGREHDKEAIIKLLLSSDYDENVSIVPIVGIGGLGKTTLAQHICDDEEVEKHFELKIWACVSDNFDVKSIVEKILESATKRKPDNSQMDALKSLLHEQINGKKYLLVLDDVWNEDFNKWFQLNDLLAGGARGSKIIITSRLKKVAEMTRPISVYEVQGLSETESWSLFKQTAFRRGQVPSPSHEALGKEIAAKCLGVPLAIKTIGGLLYFMDSESEWLAFKNQELSKVEQHENDILPTLKLSYNHLPPHLKHCFAYCSLFPKDYEIEVETLIHLWMAQGYIKSSDPNQSLGDVGLGYFMDLHRMSFFQEVRTDFYSGKIRWCKMQDLMHDLAMLVAGEECAASSSGMACVKDKTRHISMEFDRDVIDCPDLRSLFKARKVRTLFRLQGKYRFAPSNEFSVSDISKVLHAIFFKLRCLRVLDLSWWQIEKGPSSIHKLKHLRYLDLSWNFTIEKLPNSITKLLNLQVVKICGCFELKQLPKDIKKLINLRHLDNSGCDGLTDMPGGIGQLTRLEKLSMFVIAKDNSLCKRSGGLDELHALNNLRGELAIENLGYVKNAAFEFKAVNLKEKQHLQRLSLCWNGVDDGYNPNDEMALEELRPNQNLKELDLKGYRGAKVSSWFPSLTNFVVISFTECTSIQRLPSFDHLPSLQRLWIRTLTNLEYIDLSDGGSASFFPSLRDISLTACPNLKGFVRSNADVGMMPPSSSSKAELPCFPCLSMMQIGSCPNLTYMPPFPSLNSLRLREDGMKSLKNILKLTPLLLPNNSSSPSSSSPFSALSQLEYLEIWKMEEFTTEELLQNLTSLEKIEIWLCPLKTLSNDEKDDGMVWQSLRSLRSFTMGSMPNLESLPKGLRCVTTLQSLWISGCPNLMSLPECMDNLQHLTIKECPKLSERCKNSMAEDWSKISHIPNISIDDRSIQRNGWYLL